MKPVDIYLLGSGIYGSLQFSLETIQALRASRAAFVLHDDLMVHEQIRQWCADVRDLADLYKGETVRAQVYRRISELLVEEATKEPSVAFVVHGHPLFLVSATEYTMELASAQNLRVRMLPAISSFDTLLCDLGIDYGYGLQLFDATTMIRSGWQPNPHIPMLIFQLATILDDKIVFEPDKTALRTLSEYLSPIYPQDHLCTVVHSGTHILEPSSKVVVKLGKLARSTKIELWKRPTLYVPPIA
jgi:uncharacterized protein YabN with tetrapyrrole methylase and pyrophosphatase domain